MQGNKILCMAFSLEKLLVQRIHPKNQEAEKDKMSKEIKCEMGFIISPPCGIMEYMEVGILSSIIVTCGSNYCTFVSDGRCVTYNEYGKINGIKQDDFRKIFKLNDKVIYGRTGKFFTKVENPSGVDLLEPFKEYPDKSIMTMPIALKSILKYLDKEKLKGNNHFQTHILGGKDNKGQFCIYTVQYKNAETPYEPQRYDFLGENMLQVRMSVPNIPAETVTKILNRHIYAKAQSRTDHKELIFDMEQCVNDIAKIDETVGGKIFVESVF
jgi:hypothetical protein